MKVEREGRGHGTRHKWWVGRIGRHFELKVWIVVWEKKEYGIAVSRDHRARYVVSVSVPREKKGKLLGSRSSETSLTCLANPCWRWMGEQCYPVSELWSI